MSRLAGLLLGAGIVLAPSPAQDGWDRAETAIDRLGIEGELGESPDRAYLQGMGEGTIEFSRHLDVASPERIRQAHENHGEGALRPVHHDGIEDGFQGKASGIWYFTGSEWIELVGAD